MYQSFSSRYGAPAINMLAYLSTVRSYSDARLQVEAEFAEKTAHDSDHNSLVRRDVLRQETRERQADSLAA